MNNIDSVELVYEHFARMLSERGMAPGHFTLPNMLFTVTVRGGEIASSRVHMEPHVHRMLAQPATRKQLIEGLVPGLADNLFVVLVTQESARLHAPGETPHAAVVVYRPEGARIGMLPIEGLHIAYRPLLDTPYSPTWPPVASPTQ